MTTKIATRGSGPIDAVDDFRRQASMDIQRMLIAQVGKERATQAASRIGLALAAAVRSARDPSAIMSCSRGSIVQCVASACAVDLYPRANNSPVWLVPKKGELQFWLSHIGIATLAQRAGIALRPVVVHQGDDWAVEFGDVTHHVAHEEAIELADLAGVYVVVKRIADGAVIGTPWVPATLIQRRRRMGGPVWNTWPIEMAMKTAIKYLVARGIIVIDLPEMALAMDAEPAESQESHSERTTAPAVHEPNDAAGLLGLPEHIEEAELLEEAPREVVTVSTTPEAAEEAEDVQAEEVKADMPPPVRRRGRGRSAP